MKLLPAFIRRWRSRRAHERLFASEPGVYSQGRWLPETRVSLASRIEHPERLQLADHVTIGHFNLIDASAGVVIDEGVHISNHVTIVSCSSHRSRRLLGRAYAGWPASIAPSPVDEAGAPARHTTADAARGPDHDAAQDPTADAADHLATTLPDGRRPPPGWIAGAVHIGAYSFIGPHSLIEAGTRLGRGCIVCAGAQVRGDFVDFSIIEGAPARVIGDSRRADQPWLQQHPELLESYAEWAGPESVER
jgi:acetyltransferase-like isoleucine patch superfamily enzyme